MSTLARITKKNPVTEAPAVSIIVPTFGRENQLVACVESVVRQEATDWELIVIDQDPSRKLGRLLADRFPGESRLRYLNAPKAGLSRAKNIGIETAAGAILAFLDDDTVAEPTWLNGILEAFSEYPDAGIVAGRIWPRLNQEIPSWFPESKQYLLGLYDIGDSAGPMPHGDLPIGANMAVRRDIAVALGGFDLRFGFNYFRRRPRLAGEDSMLALQARDAGHKLYYSPRATVWHQIGPGKLTRDHFVRRHFWEGVTHIEMLTERGETTASVWAQTRYHGREALMAFARFLLPNYENRYAMSTARIRMISLSRVAYSIGVIFGANFPSVRRG